MKALMILSQLILLVSSQSIIWTPGNNWALNCDFKGNDFKNVKTTSSQCGGTCAQTQGCTHFSWNDLAGGTCWLKKGTVCKKDAFYKPNNVCGGVVFGNSDGVCG